MRNNPRIKFASLLLAVVAIATTAQGGMGELNFTYVYDTVSYYQLPSAEPANSLAGIFIKSQTDILSLSDQSIFDRQIVQGNEDCLWNGTNLKKTQLQKPTAKPPTGMILRNWLLVEAYFIERDVKNNDFFTDAYLQKLQNEFGTSGPYFCFFNRSSTSLTIEGKDFADLAAKNSFIYYLFPCFGYLQYTIAYDANGGSGEPDIAGPYIYTNKVDLSSKEPSKGGYTFVNWKLGNSTTYFSAGATALTGASFDATNDNQVITLTAQWTTNKYTVVFDANGMTGDTIGGEMGKMDCLYDTIYTLPKNAFTRKDASYSYSFVGWTNQTITTAIKDGAAVSNLTTVAGETVVLYAKWDRVKKYSYTIVFSANDAENVDAMLPKDCYYGTEYSLPPNTFTKTGYTFAGWTTNGTNEIVFEDRAVVSNLSTKANATNTFYAVWSANEYTLTFDANDGEGTMEETNCIYDVACALPSNSFTRYGYEFVGWATNGTDETVFEDGSIVSNLTAVANTTVTLSAVWDAKTYALAFKMNGGDALDIITNLLFDSALTLPSDAGKKFGHTFTGWSVTKNGEKRFDPGEELLIDRVFLEALGADSTLYAVWERADKALCEALDLSPTDGTFLLQSTNGWAVTTTESSYANGTSCLKTTTNKATFDMEFLTKGTLTFSYQINGSYQLMAKELDSDSALFESSEMSPNTGWLTATNKILKPMCLRWIASISPYSSDSILLDNFVWMPEGAATNPEPTAGDKPEISAPVASGNAFCFSFTAQSQFDYTLHGTNDLTTTAPWPIIQRWPEFDGTIEVTIPIAPDKPCMFYKIKVNQKAK